MGESDPSYSPDGNYIIFLRDFDLWIMRADGSEKRLIARVLAELPAWSPDGSKIALSRSDSIETINPDGSGLTTVFFAPNELGRGVSWSPDGSKLTFSRANVQGYHEIWMVKADGTGPTRLTFSASPIDNRSPDWSPDGSTIVFSSDRGCLSSCFRDLYTVPSAGGAVQRLTSQPNVDKRDPVWSPDGSAIVFTGCTYDANTDTCPYDLYRINADGGGITALQTTAGLDAAPDWQPAVGPPLPPVPDALDRISFSTNRYDSNGYDVFSMNPDGTGQKALTGTSDIEQDPAWSPRGDKVAFAAGTDKTRDFEIYVMNADGSGRTDLTNTVSLNGYGVSEFAPAWSPDGTRIVYSRWHANNPIELWVMNADGTGQALLATGSGNSIADPDWSPDGTKIVFTRLGAIWTVNADGSGMAQLLNPQPSFDETPAWSPDGHQIAFSRDDPTTSNSPANIWVMNADGTGQHQITSAASDSRAPAWSPDGRRIAFTRAFDVFVMNADGTGQVDISNYLGTDSAPDWRPVSGYPRPKGASPMRVPLVPAAVPCSAANRQHGGPLAFGSCAPAVLSSQYLTTGTPDANGRAPRMNAYLLLRVQPGNSATPVDEADVEITVRLNDVAKQDLTDYTGELRANLPLRVTDRDSASAASVSAAATTQPFAFGFDIPCAADPSPAVGSSCALDTTADALVPGAVNESLRTLWQVGQVRIFDGGADGEGSTTSDNTVFAAQGVFIP